MFVWLSSFPRSGNTFARMLRAADYPIGMPEEAAERFLEIWEREWGTGVVLELSAPSVAGASTEGAGHGTEEPHAFITSETFQSS